MGRILAIDFGKKRIGLAVTDPLKIIATGLTTVSNKEVLDFLKKYIANENVECIIVGDPKKLNNTPSSIAFEANRFVQKLKELFPTMKIEREDERFTSIMAQQTMLMGGLKKSDRQNKETVDMISATIILQGYLEKSKLNLQG